MEIQIETSKRPPRYSLTTFRDGGSVELREDGNILCYINNQMHTGKLRGKLYKEIKRDKESSRLIIVQKQELSEFTSKIKSALTAMDIRNEHEKTKAEIILTQLEKLNADYDSYYTISR